MQTLPRLTQEQQKRFCRLLVESGFYSSMQKAKRAIETAPRCRSIFLQVIHLLSDYQFESIQDIAELYIVDDDVPANLTQEKSPNHGHDLTINTNLTQDKAYHLANESNLTQEKVRGKQKKPSMVFCKFKLPNETLERLKALDGTVSEHIRQAINHYLQEQP